MAWGEGREVPPTQRTVKLSTELGWILTTKSYMTLCVPFTFLNLNFLTSKIECSISPDRIIVLVLGSFVCLFVFCTVQFPDLNLDLRGLYFKEAFISKSKLSQINTWPASHTEASLFQRSWLILITNHLSCFFFFVFPCFKFLLLCFKFTEKE